MIGTTDYNKEYHPFGILITKTETEDDFEFMFRSIKDLVKAIYRVEYKPTILLADAAPAITNGFERVFELTKRVFCWFHVKKAIEKESNKIEDKETRSQIMNDIIQFHHYVQTDSFKTVAKLMLTKWKQDYKNNKQVESFINYFMKQWLSPKRFGWFDHYVDHVPITNNALESTNRYIKDQGN